MTTTGEKLQLRKEHFKVMRFMFEASIKLRMESISLATAASLYHRFFKQFSVDDFDPHTIAATCLYLAGKIEEEHVHLTDVLNVTYRILFREQAPLDIDTTYWNLRDSIIQCELFITRALQFKLTFNHPHKYLMHYLVSLVDWLDQSTLSKCPLSQTAWALLRDSYHGDICVRYPAHVLAISALYLALQCYGITVPYNSEARYEWWEALAGNIRLQDIKSCVTDLIDIYELESGSVS